MEARGSAKRRFTIKVSAEVWDHLARLGAYNESMDAVLRKLLRMEAPRERRRR